MPTPAQSQPVDFTAADSALVPVDLADRPAGDIPFRILANSYREQYTFNNGSVQQFTAVCRWADANDFIDFTEGYTIWDQSDATRFHRVLPYRSLFQSTMYCESCELDRYAVSQGDIRTSATIQGYPEADLALYNLTFRPRLYDMLTDAEVDASAWATSPAACKELGRYVQRILTPRVEELKLGGYTLETDNPSSPGTWTGLVPDSGFVPFVRTDVVYIWYQVPFHAVPVAAINDCGGKVNAAAFDLLLPVGGTNTSRWAAETLLFKGLAQELQPYPGPNGELLTDVHYAFSHQPNGWNKFPPPSGSGAWWPVRRKGVTPTAGLYPTADFRALFKPRA